MSILGLEGKIKTGTTGCRLDLRFRSRLFFLNLLAVFALAVAAAQTLAAALPSPARDRPAAEKPWFDKIQTHFSGRFKILGSIAWPDDDTIFEPVGTGTFYDGSSNLRLINETFFSDWGYFKADYEIIAAGGDLYRKGRKLQALFPDLPLEVFLPGASLNDDRRFMNLTRTIRKTDNYLSLQRLDRLYAALLGQWGSVRIGRQAITWGDGFIFNPMDLFNPFAPTAIDRDYKLGDDMVSTQINIAPVGNLQGIYVPRRNPANDNVQWSQSSLGGKLHVAGTSHEFDVMGAKNYDDYVIGGGGTGYLGDAAWRLDATWTFLNAGADYLSLVANLDYAWSWWQKNFYGFIEYYYNGLGKNNYSNALKDPNITAQLARGQLFVVGKNYLSGQVRVELHPLFTAYLTLINNVKDPSGIIQPYAVWDIFENFQLTCGATTSYGGRGTEFGGFTIPGTGLRTRSPTSVYLWLTYYF